MDTYVLVSREVSEGSEGKHVLDPSPPSPPSRDTSSSPWTPMSSFRAKSAKAAKGSMSSILRPLRLLRATTPYHHGHLCPGFARSQRRQRREECPRSFAPFVSFARHLLITMDAYLLVSREVGEGSEGKNVLDPSPPSPPSRDTSL